MKQFIGSISFLLISACLVQGAGAQFFFTGPGFLPDENGTNLDAPQGGKASQNLAAVAVLKDCAECPEMVVIPAGIFVMGSNKSSNEQPTHPVSLRSFLMGKTEVTQEQWDAVMGRHVVGLGMGPGGYDGMGRNQSSNGGRTLPVELVSWNDTQRFIAKLNQKTGQKYRLPSEAEWEYAARAGTTTEWSFGNDESKLGNYAWYEVNSRNQTQPVGQKLPNAFGLFDMHGNLWEWVQDCWHENYVGAPTDGSAWTIGCGENYRVRRGGSWYGNPGNLRSAFRIWYGPNDRFYFSGFRLARDL
jgi:formylglycine-generating enzyme required for sulfatase activity